MPDDKVVSTEEKLAYESGTPFWEGSANNNVNVEDVLLGISSLYLFLYK
jgi:hypothetical protein